MTASLALDYAAQPFEGTDIVALVLAVTALLCLAIRWREREPGMGWFALSMGSLSLWVAFNRHHLPSGPELNASPWYFAMCLAQAAMAPGLAAYLDVPPRRRLQVMLPILLPSIAFAASVAWVLSTGAVVPRIWLHGFTTLAFATMAAVVFWAHRREPAAGHLVLALALMSVPALAIVLVATRTDPVAIRYWAILPVMLVGVLLPSISLMRRHRALQAEIERREQAERALSAMNQSLEDQVERRTADLQDMVAGLESFNRSVSHDLRGPLGGIAGLARLAGQRLQEGDTPLAAQALGSIADQAEASTRLVASLLDLARVGEAEIRRQRLDPARVADEVIAQIRLSAQAELPRFVVHALPAVDTDPDLLRAVLANLIGNAVKFTPGGERGQIEIGALPSNGAVGIYVRDNGIGFDSAKASALFKPFLRAHGNEFEGHGIGLSIVRRAVDRLGGKVWAESTPGQGARFQFTLPQQG